MEVFRLIVDRKVEVWKREVVDIEATSLDEAVEKAYKNDYIPEGDSEYLYETEYTMNPEQCIPNQSATVEVMNSNYEILKSNYGDK